MCKQGSQGSSLLGLAYFRHWRVVHVYGTSLLAGIYTFDLLSKDFFVYGLFIALMRGAGQYDIHGL